MTRRLAVMGGWSRALILFAALALGACHDLSCMEHAHCEDTVFSRSESPDGKYLVTLAHRRCHGSRWTWVKIEEVRPHFWSNAGDYEYLLSVPVEAPASARWDGPRRLEVTSPAAHSKEAASTSYAPKTHWKEVEVTYP